MLYSILFFLLWITSIIAGSTITALSLIPSDYMYLFGFITGNISFMFLRLAIDFSKE